MNKENNIKNESQDKDLEIKIKEALKTVKNDSIAKNSRINIIKFSLWIIVIFLSIIFGGTAINRAVQNINDISNSDQWYQAMFIVFSSIGNFLEAGLFIFFISISTMKAIKYWTLWKEYLNLTKEEKEIKKAKKIVKNQSSKKSKKEDFKKEKLEIVEDKNEIKIEDENSDEFNVSSIE